MGIFSLSINNSAVQKKRHRRKIELPSMTLLINHLIMNII